MSFKVDDLVISSLLEHRGAGRIVQILLNATYPYRVLWEGDQEPYLHLAKELRFVVEPVDECEAFFV